MCEQKRVLAFHLSMAGHAEVRFKGCPLIEFQREGPQNEAK